MTIRYVLTRRDLVFTQLRMISRSRLLGMMWISLCLLVGFNSLRETQKLDVTVSRQIAYVSMMIGLWVVIPAGGFLFLIIARVLLRKNIGLLGEHRLTITDEGLVEFTIYNESMNRWSAYDRTVYTRGYLMLYVTEATAHVIPRMRPLLEGDLAAFEAAVLEKTKSQPARSMS